MYQIKHVNPCNTIELKQTNASKPFKIFQQTIAQTVQASGVGVHSGQRTTLVLKPAPANTGIVFFRNDMPNSGGIKMQADSVTQTRMATVIELGDVKISTIEHLMSACLGLSIDNLIVEVDAMEIPIMDGSSSSFIYLLQSAGIVTQNTQRHYLKINQEVLVEDGDKWAKLIPFDGFNLDFTIDFAHPALKKLPKTLSFDMGMQDYTQTIGKARTFGFTSEIEMLKKAGLGRGGHLDNVIVLDDYRILNDDLRYSDEFVRHKILDAMGDLYVIGAPILGCYRAYKSGHALNNLLIRKVLEQNAYNMVHINNT